MATRTLGAVSQFAGGAAALPRCDRVHTARRSKFGARATATSARYDQHQLSPSFAGETLGIRPGYSKQDLKRAYRRLALQYHPDVCKGDHCASKFKQINAAYELLQKLVDSSSSGVVDDRYYYSDDEEDLEEYKSGWEGAWVF